MIPPLNALILCGGLSSRMGTDKGLMPLGNRVMVEKSISLLDSAGLDWFLSINAGQQKAYAAIAAQEKFIEDNPDLPVRGPLAGLLSAHHAFPEKDWLIIACDMPDLSNLLIQKLIKQRNAFPAWEAYVYALNGEPEPMCAIYSHFGLKKIVQLAEKGSLRKNSLKYMIELLHSYTIPLHKEEIEYFTNINTPQDLYSQKSKG